MKRILLALLLPLSGLAAQTTDSTDYRRLQVGVVYGQMDHEVSFTPARAVVALRGSGTGLALRYFDHPLVGFQAEVTRLTAGWQEQIDPTLPELYVRETDYVELQILTQFSFGKGVVQPLLQVGPYLAFPLGERESLPSGFVPDATANPPQVYGFPFPFRLNYGLRAGAGLNVEIGRFTVQADARYLLGFNDVVRTGTTQAAISQRLGIGAHAGLFFAL